MWNWTCERIDSGTVRCRPESCGHAMSWMEVLDAWLEQPGFHDTFRERLAAAPFDAYRFETPPVDADSVDHEFEFVLRDAPELHLTPDPSPFAEHFRAADLQTVVTFANLGRDAILVAPCPVAADDDYAHLGAFVRAAPPAQQHALWRAVARAMGHRIGQLPVWLSTAGGGVPWLHVRLDDSPKYYVHAPYRRDRPAGTRTGPNPHPLRPHQ